MSEVRLKLPKLVVADDYHEFRYLLNHLQDLTGSTRIKFEEIGYGNTDDGRGYVAIFYTRKNDAAYKELAKSVYWED